MLLQVSAKRSVHCCHCCTPPRPPPPSSSHPSSCSGRASPRSHPLSSASSSSTCSRQRRSRTSTSGCSTQVHLAARRAWRAASSNPQPCPSASSCRSTRACGPDSCCVCAEARGGPTEQHERRTDAAARPGQVDAAGLSRRDRLAGTDGGDVHVVGAAGRTQAVAHGAPEAIGKHSQA